VSEPPVFDAGSATYSVRLPDFEGPLDLLLHLCQKHELDILNIPVAFVTEKYLEYLALLELVNLDIASEYLLMAATLAHIKSKMLLPKLPEGQEDEALDEDEDPREALIRRLLEYQKYKQAGADLAARGIAGADIFLRGAALETAAAASGPTPLKEVSLFELMDAFSRVLSKSKIKLTHDIVIDRLSINDRIHELVELLRGQNRLRFEDLFEGMRTRFDLVITFLALLEMAKLRMTRLYQSGPLAELYIESTSDAATLLSDLPERDHPSEVSADPNEPNAPHDARAYASVEGSTDLPTAMDTDAPPAFATDVPSPYVAEERSESNMENDPPERVHDGVAEPRSAPGPREAEPFQERESLVDVNAAAPSVTEEEAS
jgi:segregation and condensation protein A